jgi:hypothetical protein
MSSYLISKFGENFSKEYLNSITSIKNDYIRNDIIKYILNKNNKDAVLFLIQNDIIPKSMSLDLFQFITNNNFFDMFLNLDFTKFDIESGDDYALRWSTLNGHIELARFLIEKGSNINTDDNCMDRWSNWNEKNTIVQYLLDTYLKNYSTNQEAIEFVKKYKLFEFYEEYKIDPYVIGLSKISEKSNNILKYIDSQDLESIKKCNEFDFSKNQYYYFFKALELNNYEFLKVVFEFIENKQELKDYIDNISFAFSEEIKNNYRKLFENIEIEKIKTKINELLVEIIQL